MDYQERRFWLLLLAIVFVSTNIRLSALDHHLPDIIVEDEGSDLTRTTRLFYGEVSGVPLRYHRMLITYNNIIPMAATGLFHFVIGDVRSINDFKNLYLSNRAEFTYATRLWMTLLISMSILTVGLAGRYLTPEVGLCAAVALTINSFYTMNALYALPDALVSFSSALALWLIVRVYHFRRSRDYVFAALSLAAVMLSKLQAAPLGLAFLVAHGLIIYEQNQGQWRKIIPTFFWNKNLMLAAISGIVGNILLNPFAFLAPDLVMREFTISTQNFYGSTNLTFVQSVHLYAAKLGIMLESIWRWLAIPSAIGLWVIFARRKALHWIILSGFLILFAVILNSQIASGSQIYYWMPWVVPMSLVAGIGMAEVWAFRTRPNPIQTLLLLVVALCLILETVFLLRLVAILRQPLTQEQAQQFIYANIPPHSRMIVSDPLVYGVPLWRSAASIERATAITGTFLNQWTYQLSLPIEQQVRPVYNLYGPEITANIESYADLQALIASEQIEFYVVADYCTPQDDPASNSAKVFPPINADFVKDWDLLATFNPFASGECEGAIATRTGIAAPPALYQQVRGGPQIRIYRIPNGVMNP